MVDSSHGFLIPIKQPLVQIMTAPLSLLFCQNTIVSDRQNKHLQITTHQSDKYKLQRKMDWIQQMFITEQLWIYVTETIGKDLIFPKR